MIKLTFLKATGKHYAHQLLTCSILNCFSVTGIVSNVNSITDALTVSVKISAVSITYKGRGILYPLSDGQLFAQLTEVCSLMRRYDVRCVYIPSSDRSSWQQLVAKILPLVKEEVRGVGGDNRPLTIFGESFGAGLAMRLARDVPSLVTRLVLVGCFPKPLTLVIVYIEDFGHREILL